MIPKVTALTITIMINIAAAVAILLFMLIAMNGYSESDAMWGLGAFVLLALIVAVLMALGAFFLTGYLSNKQYNPVVTVIVSILAFSIIGSLLETVAGLIGVGVAEFVRVNF